MEFDKDFPNLTSEQETSVKNAQALQEKLPPEMRFSLETLQGFFAGDDSTLTGQMLSLANEKLPAPEGATALTFGQKIADPVELARKAMLKAVYGDLEAPRELGRRRMEEVEREMAGLDPSPLEKLLAQQAAICWFQLYHYEGQCAARMNLAPQDSLGFQREEFYQKRLARAQRRFESAVKTLAQVRRLQLPTMQFNIADKQVNVGAAQVTVGAAQVNVLAEPGGEE